MPTIDPKRLDALARRILVAAGAPDDIAECVAESLIEANLKGVDSHGVMNLPFYLEEIEDGDLVPTGRMTVEQETVGTAVLRGGYGFGMYILREATEFAIAKAREQRAVSVGVVDLCHTGRVGWFAEAIAAAGMFGVVFGGGAHRNYRTSPPHGGAEPFFSTNPYAFGMPGGRFGPVVADFATSTVADGKVRAYHARGEQVPEGWIVDKAGNPTTDPQDFLDGGMHIPAAHHKGYGMALIAELMSDAMMPHKHQFNWLVTVVDITAFRPRGDYEASADALLQKVKDVPPAAGVDGVLLPGEPEALSATERAAGIPVPDPVWEELGEAAAKLGVKLE